MTKQSSDPVSHNKPCTICHTPRPVLVRCQIDETGKWYFVCPGKCWTSVSGGEVDAKGHEAQYPYYRYGGMWKNKHEDGPLNAKKPKKKKSKPSGNANSRVDNNIEEDDAGSIETVDSSQEDETVVVPKQRQSNKTEMHRRRASLRQRAAEDRSIEIDDQDSDLSKSAENNI